MGSFKLGGMTFGSLFKKPETLRYPFEKKEPYAQQKGHIYNHVESCILCGMCQRSCPCNCISVEKKERRWEINPFICIQCGSCVRACPTNCLEMKPEYTPVAAAKYCNDVSVPEKEKDKA